MSHLRSSTDIMMTYVHRQTEPKFDDINVSDFLNRLVELLPLTRKHIFRSGAVETSMGHWRKNLEMEFRPKTEKIVVRF